MKSLHFYTDLHAEHRVFEVIGYDGFITIEAEKSNITPLP